MPETSTDRVTDRAPDRRIARTEQALKEALIDLTEERGLDGFTVGEICERADVNRGTFYNHYADKDGLVTSLEDEFMSGLECFRDRTRDVGVRDVLHADKHREPLPLLTELFAYLRGQGDFLHAMLGSGGDAGFGPRLSEFVCESLVRPLLHEKYRTTTDPFVDYYLAFYSNAYRGIISRWVATGMTESAEEMAVVALRLLFIKPGEAIRL